MPTLQTKHFHLNFKRKGAFFMENGKKDRKTAADSARNFRKKQKPGAEFPRIFRKIRDKCIIFTQFDWKF